jgi:hypothetical protein
MAREWSEARSIAQAFLRGDTPPLETALALSPFYQLEHRADLEKPLQAFVAVASETDAIPLGERRTLWHPNVKALEDAKHDRAQDWARSIVARACEQLLAAIPDRNPNVPGE